MYRRLDIFNHWFHAAMRLFSTVVDHRLTWRMVKSETRRDAEILVRNPSPRLFGKKFRDSKKVKTNHAKTRLRDLSKTLPRFRDPAKIFRDPRFSRYHTFATPKSVKHEQEVSVSLIFLPHFLFAFIRLKQEKKKKYDKMPYNRFLSVQWISLGIFQVRNTTFRLYFSFSSLSYLWTVSPKTFFKVFTSSNKNNCPNNF